MRSRAEFRDFLARFQLIMFDLDGVIVDSNELKVSCIRESLSNFDPQIVEAFIEKFRLSFGKTRRQHFEYFYWNYANSSDSFEVFYDMYAEKYTGLLEERYASAPLCMHAASTISWLASRSIPLFVVTGTMTEEAEKLLHEKHLREYFVNIFGAPMQKEESVKIIMRDSNIPASNALLIGDALHDLDSAMASDVPFLFVQKYSLITDKQIFERTRGKTTFVHSTPSLL